MSYGGDGIVMPLFDGSGYEVEWGAPQESHGGTAEDVLSEELYHCFQKYDGKGAYTPNKEYSIKDEVAAKEFSGRMSTGFNMYFFNQNTWQPTQMNIMSGGDLGNTGVKKELYLKGGANVTGYQGKNYAPNGFNSGDFKPVRVQSPRGGY